MQTDMAGQGRLPSDMGNLDWTNTGNFDDLMLDEETVAAIMTMPLPPISDDHMLLSHPLDPGPPPPYSETAPVLPDTAPVASYASSLAPIPVSAVPSRGSSASGSSGKPRVAAGGNKKWASDDDWEFHRPTITRLYVKENKKLWQLVDYMEREHQFFATPKMYKTRFKRWGLWKNTKAADVAEVLRQTGAGTESDIPGNSGPSSSTPAASETTITTTKTITKTTTVITTTKITTTTTASTQSSTTPPAQLPTITPENNQVFLVNGKQVDIRRVERYIRNRCRQHRVRPGDLSATLMNLTSGNTSALVKTATGTGSPKPLGFGSFNVNGSGSAHLLLSQEASLRIIQSYFDGSLSSGRWSFADEANCDLDTAGGSEMARLSSEFHERFKIAAPLLAEGGTKNGAEGVKMARICFSELPRILSGGDSREVALANNGRGELGPEDPHMMAVFLIVLQSIRKQGEKLRWIEVQLAKYMADLAASLPGGKPTRQVWAAIRDAVIDRTLDDEFSLQLCKVSMDICRKHLGPLHAKTMELTVAGVCNFDVGDSDEVIQRQEDMFREMLDGLDKAHGAVFDERHAGVRMNLATFYNFRKMWEKAEALGLDTVQNKFIFEESKRYRGMVFKYFYDLGKARYMLKKYDLAVESYRDAIAEAKREMEEHMGGEANVIEGLVNLETCLREMGRVDEAEEALKEREMWVKEGLKGAGEPGEIEEVTV